ncbi:MAG: hypothetical protein OXF51_06000 [Alphaproteobacteria bacterium]|nr:hypothetical protein [Alphaproteobacteria bacterium]
MPLDNQGNLAGVTGANGRLYYRDGANWYEVQGVSSMAIAPDQAQAQTQTGFEGTVTFPGAPTIGQATFETASVVPLHRSWKYLADEENRPSVSLRFETARREIAASAASGETVAIATAAAGAAAAATLAGITQAELGTEGVARGMVLVAGNDLTDKDAFYVIEQLSGDGLMGMMVSRLDGGAISTMVAATRFSVIVPILRWTISGAVVSVPKGDIDTGSPITGQLIIQPRRSVELPVAVGEHTGA